MTDRPEMIDVAGGTTRGSDGRIALTAFRLARTPATNAQFALFAADSGQGMGLHTPRWGLADDDPVVDVSWYAAVQYANWLSGHAGLQPAYEIDEQNADPDNHNQYDHVRWTVRVDWHAGGFRLPTEAEWEYAARGGRDGQDFSYAGSDDLAEVGWFAQNSERRTHAVATKQPNALGLHDMSGNVWEWCWDWYDDTPTASGDDPRGPGAGTFRVVRGGSWYADDEECLVANRNYANPHLLHDNYGLRLAQSVS